MCFGVGLFLFFLGIVEAASFAAILLPKWCGYVWCVRVRVHVCVCFTCMGVCERVPLFGYIFESMCVLCVCVSSVPNWWLVYA